MKKIITMMFFLLSAYSYASSDNLNIVKSPSEIEKNQAIEIFNDPNSDDKSVAYSILIFGKYAKKDDTMLYYLGKANYEKRTRILSLDQNKGFLYIEKAANKGQTDAEYDYAKILLEKGQKENAIVFLKKSANKKNEKAQYYLGKMYYMGDIVEKNQQNGFKLISLSAKSGNQNAQYDLAKIYFSQKGTEMNRNGIYWLERAAAAENLKACDELYKIFINGEITPINIQKHMKYLMCSAYNDNDNAQFLLANYLLKGQYINKYLKASAYWFKILAEKREPKSSVLYAKYIFINEKDNKEKKKGVEYLEKVADKSIEASMMLGEIYKKGIYGKRQDTNKAIKYFEIASSLGDKDAKSQILELLDNK